MTHLQVERNVQGYRVTFHPQAKKNNEYYVKFTVLTSASLVQQMGLPPDVEVVPEGREAAEEERYEVVSEPGNEGGGSQPKMEDDCGEEKTGPSNGGTSASAEELKGQILEALLGLLEGSDQETAGQREERPRRALRTSNNTRRRRRRHRRRHAPSEPSMYEVVDVEYESISSIKSPPQLDWRIIPRYELKPWEAARQEKELYYLMTTEKSHEPTSAPRPGEPACCVCHENLATRVVVPCGHRCLCRPCALHIATNRSALGGVRLAKMCPICQAAVGLIPRLR